MKSQEFATLRESELLDSIGKKAEVTDAHEAIGQYVKQEAADEFVGIEGHRLQPVFIASVPVTKSDLSVFHVEDAVIG